MDRSHDDDATSTVSSGCMREVVLLPRNGTFDWIFSASDNHSRKERSSIAKDTSEAAHRGWYYHGNEKIPLVAADAAEAGTTVISPSCGIWPVLPPRGRANTEVRRADGTTPLDVALKLARQDKKVAVVSVASAQKVGGGFLTGDRHALEETLCVRTTLHRCLRHAWRQTGVREGTAYISPDGVVVSPRVEVFRDVAQEGYATLPEPIELACVISVAMPNLNSRVQDASGEKKTGPAAYCSSLCDRWRAVFRAAFFVGVSDIVCHDAGCGALANNPVVVGTALGEVLRMEYWGHIKNLWLVGSKEFCLAVDAGIASASPQETNFGRLKGRLLDRMGDEKPSKGSTVSFRKLLAAAAGLGKESTEANSEECQSVCSSRGLYLGSDTNKQKSNKGGNVVSGRIRLPWNRSNSVSTTVSEVDSDGVLPSSSNLTRQHSQQDNGGGSSPNPNVSRSSVTLTEELLKAHLENLLKDDGFHNNMRRVPESFEEQCGSEGVRSAEEQEEVDDRNVRSSEEIEELDDQNEDSRITNSLIGDDVICVVPEEPEEKSWISSYCCGGEMFAQRKRHIQISSRYECHNEVVGVEQLPEGVNVKPGSLLHQPSTKVLQDVCDVRAELERLRITKGMVVLRM